MTGYVGKIDQFFRIEKGQGKVIMNGEESVISDGEDHT